MNYNDKLKLAKEALESGSYDKDTIEYIFPELKESEDERIRKYITKCVCEWWNRCNDPSPDFPTKEKMLAWLEKQGQDGKVWFYRDDYVRDKKQAYQDGIDNVLNNPQKYGLEKQGEHANFLSKIQVGDKVTRNEDGVLVNLSQLNRVAKKDEKQGEQKPAKWSEEDEKMLNDVIKDLVHPWNEYIPDRIEDEIKWLKNKLKSLRPQSHWKPSEEQLTQLSNASNGLYYNCETLLSLLEQLKKLKD